MIPDHLIGSMVALSPAEAIATIRRRLDDGGEAGDLATSNVRALLAAHDAGERAARAAAWALSQAEATVAVLRGRVEAAEGSGTGCGRRRRRSRRQRWVSSTSATTASKVAR